AVELFDCLLHVRRLDEDSHASHAGRLALARRDAVDAERATAQQSEHAVECGRSIFHQRDESVPHACASARVIISPMLLPGGTSGNTFASRSTRKSSTADPS